MKTTLLPIFASLAAVAALALPAQAADQGGDAKAGQGKVAMCIGCHSINNYKSSFPEVYHVPKIAGQNAPYLASALADYRKGERKHPSMRGIAMSLNDEDIADVAAYYEALGKEGGTPEVPATPPKAGNKVASMLEKGACISCHGENFSAPTDPSYPKLAGQHADYLYAALKAYKDNSHATWGRGNAVMAGMVKQFSLSELKAMSRYIASLPGEIKSVQHSRFR